MSESDIIDAWHFCAEDRRLGYGDGREIRVGETLTVSTDKQPLELCEWGLHASERVLDALNYASSGVLCRVELSGEILRGDDKLCAAHRTTLAMGDVTNVLHEFACWCAERAIDTVEKAGIEVDPRCRDAIAAKRRWIAGEITAEELDAARDAAGDAAGAAAWAAARDAAWAAAWTAAGAAAWAAARDAAWAAAWTAARAAARDAALDAAGDAALDAARDAQADQLERMCRKALGLDDPATAEAGR